MKLIQTIMFLYFFSVNTSAQFSHYTQLNGPFTGEVRVIQKVDTEIYAGTGGGGLFYSTDNGTSWIYSGLGSRTVRGIVKFSSGKLLAVTDFGIYTKDTPTSSWSFIPMSILDAYSVLKLSNNEVLVGTSQGIYKTNDGTNFIYTALSSSTIRCMNQKPSGELFAGTSGQGVYLSTNNGTSWEQAGLSTSYVRSITFSVNGDIYASTWGGVYHSTNNGSNWVSIGLSTLDVSEISFDSNGNLFAATWEGVYKSSNFGTTWDLLGFSELINWSVRVIDNYVFVGRDGNGIIRSTNGGIDWQTLNQGLTAARVWDVKLDLNNNIFAAVSGGGFKSTDGGNTFTEILTSTQATRVWNFCIYSANDIFAGTSKGIFKSTNSGNNFFAAGIPDASVKSITVNSNGFLFAGSNQGVHRSTDNGTTWVQINGGLTNTSVNDIIVLPNNKILTATSGGSGVYSSTNNGTIWLSSNNGLTSTSISKLFVDSYGRIYAVSSNTVFRSTDMGDSWNQYYMGYNLASIYHHEPYYVYIGTTGDGLYHCGEYELNQVACILTDIGPFNKYIQVLNEDNQSYIYAGTIGSGIFKSISPIPVELLSFTCKTEGSSVLLNWVTATETNNMGFSIERKSLEDWIEVGFVEGKGNSTEITLYSFEDNNLMQRKYYYRLKQIDYDGTFTYSNEIEIDVTAPEEFALYQNYPNPFNPVTTIKFSIPSNVKSGTSNHQPPAGVSTKLVVYDMLGREVATLVDEMKAPGRYEVLWDATGLSSGVYFYKLFAESFGQAGSFIQVRKMILLR
jgi:hypothetical protein